mmetsp:Transcript_19738/g.55647  ORF Transcript_19738/g.55647 Transcript_19738/m.55647 type:complete len:429 (+) Transcript_19738:321-1607(+)
MATGGGDICFCSAACFVGDRARRRLCSSRSRRLLAALLAKGGLALLQELTNLPIEHRQEPVVHHQFLVVGLNLTDVNVTSPLVPFIKLLRVKVVPLSVAEVSSHLGAGPVVGDVVQLGLLRAHPQRDEDVYLAGELVPVELREYDVGLHDLVRHNHVRGVLRARGVAVERRGHRGVPELEPPQGVVPRQPVRVGAVDALVRGGAVQGEARQGPHPQLALRPNGHVGHEQHADGVADQDEVPRAHGLPEGLEGVRAQLGDAGLAGRLVPALAVPGPLVGAPLEVLRGLHLVLRPTSIHGVPHAREGQDVHLWLLVDRRLVVSPADNVRHGILARATLASLEEWQLLAEWQLLRRGPRLHRSQLPGVGVRAGVLRSEKYLVRNLVVVPGARNALELHPRLGIRPGILVHGQSPHPRARSLWVAARALLVG